MHSKPIILFDGICNLCNGAVQFVIRHDPENKFLFASLQSGAGQQLLQRYQLPSANFTSFTLIQDDKVYTQSTAALKVAKQLKGGWRYFYYFSVVPKFIRDAVYTLIAKNRYRWFGKKDACIIPTEELKARFL
jgi:predicted DCC family thiol-disulfide oxidoreductase YuxK